MSPGKMLVLIGFLVAALMVHSNRPVISPAEKTILVNLDDMQRLVFLTAGSGGPLRVSDSDSLVLQDGEATLSVVRGAVTQTFPNQYGACECTVPECMDVFALCGTSSFTVREDLLERGSPATAAGGPSLVVTEPSRVYSFNGLNNLTNNWISIPNEVKTTFLTATGTSAFTLSFWLRVEQGSNSSYIVAFEIERSRYFSLFEASTSRVILYYFRDPLPGHTPTDDDGYNTQVALSFYYDTTALPSGLRDGHWHFLALTINFPSILLLVDGVEYQPTQGNFRDTSDSTVNLDQNGANYTMPAPILVMSASQISSIDAKIGGSARGNQFALFGEMRQVVISNIVNNSLYACLASCDNIIGVDPQASFPDFVTFYNPVIRVFDFSGNANEVGYTNFLQSVVYYTNGFLPSEEAGERKVITLHLSDEQGLGNEAQINIIRRSNQNDPLLDINGDLVTGIDFTVELREDIDEQVEILSPRSFITDTDIDSTILSVTVNLTNAQNGPEETLRLLNAPPSLVNVTGYDRGTLTAGSSSKIVFIESVNPLRATANVFITTLLSLRYSNIAEEPLAVDRIIEFTVFDGLRRNNPRAVTTINILATNDLPVVDLNGLDEDGVNQRTSYIESSPPTVLAADLQVNDPDSSRLTEINARIDRVFDTGNESIAFDTALLGSLTCTPTSCNGTDITITGSSSRPAFQRLLRTLQYVNLQQSTNLPSLRDRTVFVTISDGVNTSDPQANILIDFIPINPRMIIELDAPNQNYSTNFVEAQTEPIFCHSLVRAVDTSKDTLETIVVSIRDVLPDGVTEDEEVITITSTAGLDITVEINTALKRITFSQVASIDQYLQAVRRIQYFNGEPEPLLIMRAVDFLVIPGGGAPSDTAVCSVTIQGINDHVPECQLGELITIPENETGSYDIIQLQATDMDRGIDGELTYQIVGEDYFLFEVTEDGLVRLTASAALDRESAPEYSLNVTACDRGTSQLCCQFNLTLLIGDVNDNPPVFNSTTYSFEIAENIMTDFPAIFGISDADEGSNSELSVVEIDADSFSVRAGCFDHFSVRVDSDSGILLSTFGLNFEQASECNFQVTAYDAGVPRLSSQANVTVRVINVDDVPPMFLSEEYTFCVEEANSFPLVIGQVEAVDVDSPSLSYSVEGASSLFFINATSGEVYILFASNHTNATQYTITAVVTDPPGAMATATITVFIDPINNDPPVLDLNVTDTDSLNALTPTLFVEEGTSANIATEPSVTDPDELDLTVTLIVVRVANSPNPANEILTVVGANSASIDTNIPGQLTIRPQSPTNSTEIHSLLQSILYRNTEDEISACQGTCEFGPLSRTLIFTVNDGRFTSGEARAFVVFQLVNDSPFIDLDDSTPGQNYRVEYTEGTTTGVHIVNSNGFSITDEDSTQMLSLICNLTNPLDAADDSLSVEGVLPPGLTLNSTAHLVWISGIAPITDYMATLGLVQYSSTSNNPNTADRHIEVYVADDEELVSNLAVTVITFARIDPPTLDLDFFSIGFNYSVTYTENAAPVSLSNFPMIRDMDSVNLQNLTVTIIGGRSPEDLLTLDPTTIPNSLTSSYTFPQLTVTGSATLATYTNIIRSIEYNNTADEIADTTSRTIEFVITDDSGGSSTPVATTVAIVPVDDNPPTFVPNSTYSFNINENAPRQTLVGSVVIVDTDLPPRQDTPVFSIISATPPVGSSDFLISSDPVNSFQGDILVNGLLDFDAKAENYSLMIRAQSSSRYTTASISISVQNLPDLPPEFDQCPPMYRVFESDCFSSPPSPSSCTAVDPDGLDPIMYSIEGNEFEDSILITIDPNTGGLASVENIDRETVGVQFGVTITASDSTHSTSRNVTVQITRQNEHTCVTITTDPFIVGRHAVANCSSDSDMADMIEWISLGTGQVVASATSVQQLMLEFNSVNDSIHGSLYTCSVTRNNRVFNQTLSINVTVPLNHISTSVNGSGSLLAGSEFTLTCIVSESISGLTNSPSAVWMVNNRPVMTGSVDNSTDGTTTLSVLTFNPLKTSHSGQYTCIGTLSSPALNANITTSQNISVFVQIPIPDVFISVSAGLVAGSDEDITLTCSATLDMTVVDSGNLQYSFTWQDREGNNITSTSRTTIITSSSSSSSLTLSPLSTTDTNFTCIVTIDEDNTLVASEPGRDSITLELIISPPVMTITASPVDSNFFTGLRLNLTCNIQISITPRGYNEVRISAQWSKSGSTITTNSRYSVEETVRVTPLLYQTSLVFSSLDKTRGDEGNYSCSATITPNLPDITPVTGSASYIVRVETSLFQLRLIGVTECETWKMTNRIAGDTDIVEAIINNIVPRCECDFTEDRIRNRVFQCFPSSPQAVTYRAELHGTLQASVPDLIGHIEQWIASEPVISVNLESLALDGSCAVAISSLTETECADGETTTTGRVSSSTVIGISVGVVVLLALMMIMVTIVIAVALTCRNRQAAKMEGVELNVITTLQEDAIHEYECIDNYIATPTPSGAPLPTQQSGAMATNFDLTSCPAYVPTTTAPNCVAVEADRQYEVVPT